MECRRQYAHPNAVAARIQHGRPHIDLFGTHFFAQTAEIAGGDFAPDGAHGGAGHDDRWDSPRAEQYPYLIVSNHPRWRVHANLDDTPWFREIETCKVVASDGYAYEPVWINPVDAEKLGVEAGDVVSIYNERGSVLGGVRITERIMPGVVSQDHGAHCDPVKAGHGGLDRGGANNAIAPSPTSSKNAVGEVTSGYLVGVEKVDPAQIAHDHCDCHDFNPANYTVDWGLCVEDSIVD